MSTITLGGNTYNLIVPPASPGFSDVGVSLMDAVAVVSSPYTPSQSQTQQWPGADAWGLQLSLPKMTPRTAAAWRGFLGAMIGMQNVIQVGDPLNKLPLGAAKGAPVAAATVISLALGAGGTGYTSAPTVGFTGGGGTGASATAVLTGGSVTGFAGLVGGEGFTSAPTISFTGGGGTGAAAIAQISNAPSSIVLYSRGWTASVYRQLLSGDYIQIGNRLYMATGEVDADANGDAAIPIWPSLRETPADGAVLKLTNCQGVFRLASNLRKWHAAVDQLAEISFQFSEVR
jgi:hypothetical protein